jgi:uncharacterized protein YbaP (TraB family)
MSINNIFNSNRLKLLPIFLFLAFVWTPVNTVNAEESLQVKAKGNCLWVVDTGKNNIYLLGSIHVLKRDSFPLHAEIEKAYDNCKTIVLETNLDAMNSPALQAKMLTLGLYPDGQMLQKNVSGQTYTLLNNKLIEAGLSVGQFDGFKPWLCALTLAAMELQRLGFDPNHGMDKYFFDRAKKDGKEMVFLETAEYQLNLFAKMSKREQESMLRQTLKDLELVETMASDMVHSWETGDVDKLDSIIKMSFKEYPDIYSRLFVKRNKEWVQKIESLTEGNQNVLVIVGVGHLVGTQSLLELLKEEMAGWHLKQQSEDGRREGQEVFDGTASVFDLLQKATWVTKPNRVRLQYWAYRKSESKSGSILRRK